MSPIEAGLFVLLMAEAQISIQPGDVNELNLALSPKSSEVYYALLSFLQFTSGMATTASDVLAAAALRLQYLQEIVFKNMSMLQLRSSQPEPTLVRWQEWILAATKQAELIPRLTELANQLLIKVDSLSEPDLAAYDQAKKRNLAAHVNRQELYASILQQLKQILQNQNESNKVKERIDTEIAEQATLKKQLETLLQSLNEKIAAAFPDYKNSLQMGSTTGEEIRQHYYSLLNERGKLELQLKQQAAIEKPKLYNGQGDLVPLLAKLLAPQLSLSEPEIVTLLKKNQSDQPPDAANLRRVRQIMVELFDKYAEDILGVCAGEQLFLKQDVIQSWVEELSLWFEQLAADQTTLQKGYEAENKARAETEKNSAMRQAIQTLLGTL
jgi:hypothetical protein